MGRKVVAPLRREQILNGLFDAMSRKGFDSVSITDIARESGVTRGILHYYFENKDEMLVELMRSISQLYVRRLRNYLAKVNSPSERLGALLRFHTLGNEQEVRALAGVWVEYWGKAAGGHSVGSVIAELQGSLRKIISEILTEGLADGTYVGINPETASVIVLGALEGILLQWRVNSSAIDLRIVLSDLESLFDRLSGRFAVSTTGQSPLSPHGN